MENMAARATGAPPTVTIGFATSGPTETQTDALILAVPPGDGAWKGAAAEIDAAFDGGLRAALQEAGFTGKIGQTQVVPTFGRIAAKRIVATGLGASGAS